MVCRDVERAPPSRWLVRVPDAKGFLRTRLGLVVSWLVARRACRGAPQALVLSVRPLIPFAAVFRLIHPLNVSVVIDWLWLPNFVL